MKKTTIALALLAAPCLTATAQDTYPDLMETILTSAETELGYTGVGYPAQMTKIRATLQSAIADAEEVKNVATIEDINALNTVLAAYRNSADIELPADGKTYTLTFWTSESKRAYVNYDASGYRVVSTDESSNANYPLTAKFVCRDLGGGQYAFVNNEGKYFCHKGYDGANDNKGYTDAFDATYSPLTIEKMAWEDRMEGNASKLLGCVTVSGTVPGLGMEAFTTDLRDFGIATALVFDDMFTSAIRIEEAASLGNTVTLNPATGIDGVDNIATFSAPFATVAPEGVNVWYVTVSDAGDALMQPVEAGLAIPAGAGIILTSSATEAAMLPATTETLATLEGNKLVGSGGEALKISDVSGAYILTGRDDQVAFYYLMDDGVNTLAAYKAYLRIDAGTQAIRMNFTGTTTGISKAENAEAENAPIYDLSGRRVLQPEKGVYVKNGKKFIVKYPPTANTSKQEAI